MEVTHLTALPVDLLLSKSSGQEAPQFGETPSLNEAAAQDIAG